MKKRNPNFRLGLVPLALTFLVSTASFGQEVDLKSHTVVQDNTYVHMPEIDETKINLTETENGVDPEALKLEIEELKTALDKKDAQVTQLKEQLSNMEISAEEVEVLKNSLKDIEDEVVELQAKVIKLIAKVEENEVLKKELENQIALLKEELNNAKSLIEKMEHAKSLEDIKKAIAEKDKEVNKLHTEVLESKVVTVQEKEVLEQKATALKSDLESLTESANNIANYEGCEDDEVALKDSIKSSIEINDETIKILADLEAKGIEIEIVDNEKEAELTSEEKDEKIAELENYICDKEDEFEKLQSQVSALSKQSGMNAMMPFMMMQMMQQNMEFMSRFSMAPSVADKTDMFSSMMMMSAINNMNMTNNFGMMGMMSVLGGLGQQNPMFSVGGNYYAGNYDYSAVTNPAAQNNPAMTYGPTTNFGYNFDNTDRNTPSNNGVGANDVDVDGTGLDA